MTNPELSGQLQHIVAYGNPRQSRNALKVLRELTELDIAEQYTRVGNRRPGEFRRAMRSASANFADALQIPEDFGKRALRTVLCSMAFLLLACHGGWHTTCQYGTPGTTSFQLQDYYGDVSCPPEYNGQKFYDRRVYWQ